MTDVRIDTARGVTLAGTLMLPADADPLDLQSLETALDHNPDRAPARLEGMVILAHDFLTDRHGLEGRLDALATRYQEAGLATFSFDFSGLGESDDDVITLAGEVEDLQAVSGWLARHGFTRQGIHANGFGATAALLARPDTVRTAVVVGAVVGPQSILWEEVFSPEQLDELDRHGLTRLMDDNPNRRKWDVLSKETLADVSLQTPEKTMADLPWPVLMLNGALTNEFPDTVQTASYGFKFLPEGSQLAEVHGDRGAEALDEIAEHSIAWMRRFLS